MDFRLLGPLEVHDSGRPVALGSRKQRALLALLLLHAGEPLPPDRLIEALWGERAPASALNSVHIYISQLRKLLGRSRIATGGTGYTVDLGDDELDLRRFERLLGEGRERLAAGEPAGAAATLRDALALWRGPPLADFTHDEFAQNEIRRLEDERLAAVEERIEAELALGRQDALIPELEALVAAHPYRERLRGQLMLALYRSGRQADALEVYRRGRRLLAEEVGIEPGRQLQQLEVAILRQDPSLEVHASAMRIRPGRRRFQLALGLVLVVLAGSAALALATRDGGSEQPRPVHLEGNSVAVIDPVSNAVVGEIPVGGRPTGLALGEGSVWVGNRDDKTLVRIDARSRRVVRTIGLGVEPGEVAVRAGDVWVTNLPANKVLRVDAGSNEIVATIPLSKGGANCCAQVLAAGAPGVWAADDGLVSRIDPATNAVVDELDGLTIAVGAGTLWIWDATKGLRKLDPATNSVVQTMRFSRVSADADFSTVAVGADAVWVANLIDKTVWRIDPGAARLTDVISVGHPPGDVAIGEGGVWVAGADGTVVRIDPRTRAVTKAIALGVYPPNSWSSIAAGLGAVWVAVLP